MRSILALSIVGLLSFSLSAKETFTAPKLCWSNGQCQTAYSPKYAERCYLVFNETSCELKCFQLPVGSSCEPIEGHAYGYCKTEQFPKWTRDPSCTGAIDKIDLPE